MGSMNEVYIPSSSEVDGFQTLVELSSPSSLPVRKTIITDISRSGYLIDRYLLSSLHEKEKHSHQIILISSQKHMYFYLLMNMHWKYNTIYHDMV